MFCEGSEKKQKLISYRTFFNSKKTLDVYTGVLKGCIFFLKGVFLMGNVFICHTNGKKGHLKLWIGIFRCLFLVASIFKFHRIFRE